MSKPSENATWKIFFLVCILLPVISYGQLSDFILQVTPTNETCTGNGSLAFTVSNTTPDAAIAYNVYLLPDTITPIATLSGNTLGDLAAGTYRVTATQSLGGLSNSKSQDVVIANHVVPLAYQLEGQNAVCGGDGKITVSVTQGTAVSYEIFSGPVIVPLQSSNVLTGLAAGTYQVRVFDNCGEGVVQTFTLGTSSAGMNVNISAPYALDCDTIRIGLALTAGSDLVMSYPIVVQVTVNPPSGPPIVFGQTITSGTVSQAIYTEDVPLYPGLSYGYSYIVTDNCGNTYTGNGTIGANSAVPIASVVTQNCQVGDLIISHVSEVALTEAPAAYPNALPYDYTAMIDNADHSLNVTNLPVGTYEFLVTDLCGNESALVVVITPPPTQSPAPSIKEGCAVGEGSFGMFGNFTSVVITAAPAGYPNPLPHDVSLNINQGSNHSFAMNGLPPGSYMVHTTDACAAEYDVPFAILGYQDDTDINLIPNCNSFDLGVYHTSNNSGTLWLQEYNALTSQWFNPLNGTIYAEGTALNLNNAVSLTNNTTNINLAFLGHFRIIKSFSAFANGTFGLAPCYRVVKEFDFTGAPKINGVYSFSCFNNGQFDVVVDAVGLPPLIYRITSKNGTPFLIENGNSSLFHTLEAAVYNFQVEDACGNILNRTFSIPAPFSLSIAPTDLCGGQPGSLSVPYFPFLQYEWWKDDNESAILSTNGTLSFAPFNLPADLGIYHVRITNPAAPNSTCIDRVLDYEVSASLNNPQAGQGNTISYCGSPGDIDLFALLSGTYSANGFWEEITASGNLSGHIWNSAVPSGTYQFKYTVGGLCGTSDDALVNITMSDVPETPQAALGQPVCGTQEIHLLATAIANATYEWTGPNGFASSEQNPVITNASSENGGIYTVRVLANTPEACPSGISSVEVGISALPEFTLSASCVANVYTIAAVSLNGAFDPAVAYSWTGPENFTSSGNPITITGLPSGNYTLTVSNGGCSFTSGIEVGGTSCMIPQGVSVNGDGANDTFNLSGFDVRNLRIFNRYGMKVYEMAGYVDQWHGQDDCGHTLPGATYYYQIVLGSGKTKTGWVYLIREN